MANNNLFSALQTQLKEAAQSFTSWLSLSNAAKKIISETKEAISELKDVNTYLTQISKTNNSLSKSALEQLGNDSFEIASKYAKTATDYLSAVQKMSSAGYKNAESLAELSLAVQCVGDMTAELSDKYITATDAAFNMNGSVDRLTETLDGANNITNKNMVNMTDLAEAMSIVGSQAASSQMKVDEITAAIGTMIAVTKNSGSEIGNAFKAILMNLQQISGNALDGESIIDAKSLSQYKKACEDLGVSLYTVKNGAASLKEPMQILKELSVEYTKLSQSDIKRENLLSAVGGENRANALNAILKNYSLYEKMLTDYAAGTGSMAREAEKAVNTWEGSLNRLSNTWTDTIGNIADSDVIITAVNGLNGLLTAINNITGALGALDPLGSLANISAISGLLMYKAGIGERTKFQW
ncbi:MAG: phage tail tape measure protein [Lachnospiraceae bacterium]|nr:phage tail tape measure protein [Lachnospiraceae bacterium]